MRYQSYSPNLNLFLSVLSFVKLDKFLVRVLACVPVRVILVRVLIRVLERVYKAFFVTCMYAYTHARTHTHTYKLYLNTEKDHQYIKLNKIKVYLHD